MDALMGVFEGAPQAARVGRAAFSTWYLAQLFGWDYARSCLSSSAWYNHLAVLRAAGLPVPKTGRLSAQQSEGESSGWGALVPGQVFRLAGRRFRVVSAWDEFYPAGTTGTVDAVQFRGGVWGVLVDLDGSPGGCDELALADFLASTGPIEGASHV